MGEIEEHSQATISNKQNANPVWSIATKLFFAFSPAVTTFINSLTGGERTLVGDTLTKGSDYFFERLADRVSQEFNTNGKVPFTSPEVLENLKRTLLGFFPHLE